MSHYQTPGYDALKPLIGIRKSGGISQATLSRFCGIWATRLCALEHAGVPKVTESVVTQYRDGLRAALMEIKRGDLVKMIDALAAAKKTNAA